MGALHHFNIRHLAPKHGCRRFIETGTAHGHGLDYARRQNRFDRLDSIECHAPTAGLARERFAAYPHVHIHHGDSPAVLRDLLALAAAEPVFFWLDAHFPGADIGAAGFDAEPDPAKRWPLQGELDAIAAVPDIARPAVILIDDLRIYTGQGWDYQRCRLAPAPDLSLPLAEGPNIPLSPSFPGDTPGDRPALDLTAFASTHHAEVWHWHEGYVLLLPNAPAMPTASTEIRKH